MPTYDYRCKACKHRWESFHSIKAPPEKKCPKCGKSTAERMIGPGAGIIFRGSGFYQTDYRSASYKKAAEADKKAADGSSGGDSKSSDAKSSESKASSTSSDSGSSKSESKKKK